MIENGSNVESFYRCELVENSYIIATEDIPVGVTIYEGLPILETECFVNANELRDALFSLKSFEIDHYIEETRNMFPWKSTKQIVKKLEDLGMSKQNAVEMSSRNEYILLVKILYNAFALDNGKHALYFLAAKLNHSCYPNCTWISNGSLLIMKTIRQIKKGEELTHCYYPQCLIEKNKRMRDEIIKISGRGNFICECELCMDKVERHPDFWMQTEYKESCSCCGILFGKLSRCSRCKNASYCSKECQSIHWKQGHKKICGK